MEEGWPWWLHTDQKPWLYPLEISAGPGQVGRSWHTIPAVPMVTRPHLPRSLPSFPPNTVLISLSSIVAKLILFNLGTPWAVRGCVDAGASAGLDPTTPCSRWLLGEPYV